MPVYDEVILSTAKMDRIIGFDQTYGIVSAEAGCVLQDLQEYVSNYKAEMPLDLGARGSC